MKNNIIVLDNPLLKHKLGYLRDKNTTSNEFRELVKEISGIVGYEAMKDWQQFDKVEIETPITKTTIDRIINPPVVVSIMRAGNAMLDAVLSVIPFASAGFIGIYRDKFIHNTVEYYFKMPTQTKDRVILLCDPLIATADTVLAAIERLKNYEVGQIKILSILCSQSAIDRIHHFHPDVVIHTLSIEKEMNDQGYLVPGLGDAGDRLYMTK